MLKITKHEAFKLRELGYGNYVKQSKSRHPKYYVVEQKDSCDARGNVFKLGALSVLEQYRESIKIN